MSSSHSQSKIEAKTESAVLGGGCFWCLEAIYRRLPGVLDVTPGYAGGQSHQPTYEEVCTGSTGHAESIRIHFDPSQVTYHQILKLFWKAHDPTTLNQQRADRGTQYRSIILCHNKEQLQIALDSKQAAQKALEMPIVTEITQLGQFYPAEAYHHQFYERNRAHNYSEAVIHCKLVQLENQGDLPKKE